MTRRLQPILELIVSPAQRAFVPNRSIVSNILICQDLVRGYSRATSSPRCLMKVDLRKAYDSVEWIFVERVLISTKIQASMNTDTPNTSKLIAHG